jgi:hypothetical protein
LERENHSAKVTNVHGMHEEEALGGGLRFASSLFGEKGDIQEERHSTENGIRLGARIQKEA